MTPVTAAALLAMMGGGEAWVAPVTWVDKPMAVSRAATVLRGEFHTFVVGNVAECRVAAPAEVQAKVFAVTCYPAYLYGKWHLVPYFMPTVEQLEPGTKPSGLWAVRFKADLPPGKHKFKVHIAPNDQRPPLEYPFEVVDVEIPPADIPFGMFYDFKRIAEEYRGPDFQDKYFKDMAEHGMTTSVINWFKSEDRIWQYKLMQKHGMDRFPVVLISRFEWWKDPSVVSRPLVRPNIPEDSRLLFDGSKFMMYGQDEPKAVSALPILDYERKRANHLGMKYITAMSYETPRSFYKHLDVWMIEVHVASTPVVREYARRHGAPVWLYVTIRGTGAKLQRYCSGLYTWAVGGKGLFRWAYVHTADSHVRPDGVWNEFMWFGHVLPSPDGPISTIGWEGVREGVLDYRILRALEERLIAAAEDSPGDDYSANVGTEKQNSYNKKLSAAGVWLARLRNSVDPKWYHNLDLKLDQVPGKHRPSEGGGPLDAYDPGIDLTKMRAEAISLLSEFAE